MEMANPTAFQGSKTKSGKAKAPITVMAAFFRLPAESPGVDERGYTSIRDHNSIRKVSQAHLPPRS